MIKLKGLITEANTVITEAEITTIPNMNLESDVAIEMMKQLHSNSNYKKVVSTNGVDYFEGGNPKNIINVLTNDFKRVVSPQFVKTVFATINKRSPRIQYDESRANEIVTLCTKILAMAVMFELRETPIPFAKQIGDSKLIDAANNFSTNRGKQKMGAMMKNKFGEVKTVKEATRKPEKDTYFDSFTAAAQAARNMAEKKGYEIDEEDWQDEVAMGGKNVRSRPSVGKYTKFSVKLIKNEKPQRKALNFTVYGMPSGKYELTAYIF